MATILVLKDRGANHGFLVSLLRHFGHRLLEASYGKEALELAKSAHPQLTIANTHLPEEFIHQLRADPELAHLPIINCNGRGEKAGDQTSQRTAEASASNDTRALDRGEEVFLQDASDYDECLAAVRKALDESSRGNGES